MLLRGQDGARTRRRYERETSTRLPTSKAPTWRRRREAVRALPARPSKPASSARATPVLGRGRLRPPPATGDDLAGHRAGAGIAEIRLLRAAARIGEVDPHHRALRFLDFLAAVVAHEPRNTCHGFLLEFGSLSG